MVDAEVSVRSAGRMENVRVSWGVRVCGRRRVRVELRVIEGRDMVILIESEIMLQLGLSDRGRSEEGSLTWRCLGSAGVLYLGSLGVSETGIQRLCSE